MSPNHKPLVWLHGEVKTPPFSKKARLLAGFLLRSLQKGDVLGMPDSRTMGSIAARCHELRLPDGRVDWRIIYRVDPDAILIFAVFSKKTQKTPKKVIESCRDRLKRYDELTTEK
jgi:phage-related protein